MCQNFCGQKGTAVLNRYIIRVRIRFATLFLQAFFQIFVGLETVLRFPEQNDIFDTMGVAFSYFCFIIFGYKSYCYIHYPFIYPSSSQNELSICKKLYYIQYLFAYFIDTIIFWRNRTMFQPLFRKNVMQIPRGQPKG